MCDGVADDWYIINPSHIRCPTYDDTVNFLGQFIVDGARVLQLRVNII